jgi:hypothetical protein
MAKKVEATAAGFSRELLAATAAGARKAVETVGADEQADLVDAWVKEGNVDAVAEVAADDDAPAPARKAARRGLNVLKSRGVKVPERTTVARPFAGEPERTIEGRMVPPDGSGTQVITIVSRAQGKDARVVDVVIMEGVGIARVTGGFLSNHKLREWETDAKRSRGFAPVTVSVEWARWKIAEAKKRNGAVPVPLEIEAFADLLEPVPSSEPAHPVVALGLDLAPLDAAGRVEKSANLHARPELRTYMPTRQAIQEMLVKLGERIAALGSAPAGDAMAPLLREEVASATDRFFTPEVRDIVASRLLDAAASIHVSSGKEAAIDVLATRDAVTKAGLITQPPREIPFLRAFFDKAVATLAAQGNGQLQIPVPQQQARAGGQVLSAEQLAAIAEARGESTEAPAVG